MSKKNDAAEWKLYTPEKRAEYVAQVRTDLNSRPLTDEDKEWVTDDVILRYLWGWRYEVPKVAEQICKSLEWRNSYKPHEIKFEEVAVILKKGAIFVSGFDKDGGPVIYFNPNIWVEGLKDVTDPAEEAIRLRAMIFVMQQTILRFPAGVNKYSWVIDLEDKLSDLFAIKRRKQNAALAQIFNDHFPEHLGYAVGANPPTIIKAAWKVFKKFLDPETIRKTRFAGKKDLATIQELIPKDQLLQAYGGDNPYKFNWDAFVAEYAN